MLKGPSVILNLYIISNIIFLSCRDIRSFLILFVQIHFEASLYKLKELINGLINSDIEDILCYTSFIIKLINNYEFEEHDFLIVSFDVIRSMSN